MSLDGKRTRARFHVRVGRVVGEGESAEAPAPAIDSLGYRDFKSYYHQQRHWGATSGEPLLDRGQGPPRVLSFGPGRSVRNPLLRISVRDGNSRTIATHRTRSSLARRTFANVSIKLSHLREGIRGFYVSRRHVRSYVK